MQTKTHLIYLIIIAALLGTASWLYFIRVYQPAHEISVYYNQEHPLNSEVVNVIRGADKFVYFGVYTFTREDIKDALLAAKYRGLTVIGLTDRDQYNQLDAQKKIINELRDNGIPVYQQDHQGIMHTKVVVTDKAYASGSYNWTEAATDLNDEVLEVGSDPAIRQEYQDILQEMINKYQTAPLQEPSPATSTGQEMDLNCGFRQNMI